MEEKRGTFDEARTVKSEFAASVRRIAKGRWQTCSHWLRVWPVKDSGIPVRTSIMMSALGTTVDSG